MKKFLLCILMVFLAGFQSVFAVEKIKLKPLNEIKTTTKEFQLGNTYKFKNVENGEIYTSNVVYYRPNGFFGQEAHVVFANFVDSKGNHKQGAITVVPKNHEIFQEFLNGVSPFSPDWFIRGSEVIIKPTQEFLISEINSNNVEFAIIIKPNETISTTLSYLEETDIVSFVVVNNVYKKGKLFIKSGTKIYGIIDSINENGWFSDNAEIHFKKFVVRDVNNNKITINSDLTINGFEILKYKANRKAQFFNYIGAFFRGKEIDIKDIDTDIKFTIISK